MRTIGRHKAHDGRAAQRFVSPTILPALLDVFNPFDVLADGFCTDIAGSSGIAGHRGAQKEADVIRLNGLGQNDKAPVRARIHPKARSACGHASPVHEKDWAFHCASCHFQKSTEIAVLRAIQKIFYPTRTSI